MTWRGCRLVVLLVAVAAASLGGACASPQPDRGRVLVAHLAPGDGDADAIVERAIHSHAPLSGMEFDRQSRELTVPADREADVRAALSDLARERGVAGNLWIVPGEQPVPGVVVARFGERSVGAIRSVRVLEAADIATVAVDLPDGAAEVRVPDDRVEDAARLVQLLPEAAPAVVVTPVSLRVVRGPTVPVAYYNVHDALAADRVHGTLDRIGLSTGAFGNLGGASVGLPEEGAQAAIEALLETEGALTRERWFSGERRLGNFLVQADGGPAAAETEDLTGRVRVVMHVAGDRTVDSVVAAALDAARCHAAGFVHQGFGGVALIAIDVPAGLADRARAVISAVVGGPLLGDHDVLELGSVRVVGPHGTFSGMDAPVRVAAVHWMDPPGGWPALRAALADVAPDWIAAEHDGGAAVWTAPADAEGVRAALLQVRGDAAPFRIAPR